MMTPRAESKWRGSARTDKLPERQEQIAVRTGTVIVFCERIIRERPWRIGRGIAQHDQEQRLQLLAAERRVLPANVLQHGERLSLLKFERKRSQSFAFSNISAPLLR